MQTLTTGVTQADVEFFHENGYLVVQNGLNSGEIEELRRDTVAICRGETVTCGVSTRTPPARAKTK